MSRFPRAAVGASIAVLAGSAIAPPAIAAATAPPPPPSYETRGLLDGLLDGLLGDLLGRLLGGSQQADLQRLLGLLQGGSEPTSTLLDPLTRILGQLGAAQGLPTDTRATVTRLTSLLGSGGGGRLDPSLLAPVASLLRQLAATQGLPAPAAALLNQLADALLSGGLPGLPLDELPLDPAAIGSLADVLDALARGGQPTGALLAPILPLLRQVAAAPGLPEPLRALVDDLIAAIQGTTGALDPLLVDQLGVVLSLIGNTPGVAPETRTIIERTVSVLGTRTLTGGTGGGGGSTGAGRGGGSAPTGGSGGGSAPARPDVRRAAKRDRAVVKRATIDRRRAVVTVRIACPRTAPAVCRTTVRAGVRGWPVAKAVRANVAQGTTKTVRLRVARGARTRLAKRGGRVVVNATTAFGGQRFSASTTLTVRRAR